MRLRSSQRVAHTPTPHHNLRTTSTNTLNDKHNEEKGKRILRNADTEEKEPSTPLGRTTRRAAHPTATEKRRVTRQPAEKEDVVATPRTARETKTTRRSVRMQRGRSESEAEGDRTDGSTRQPTTITELVSKDKVAIRDDSDDSSSLSSFQSPTEEFKLLSDFGSESMFLRSSPTPQQRMIIPRSLPVVSRMVKMTLNIVPEGETEETTERTKERQSTSLPPGTEGKHSRDINYVEMERAMNEQQPTMGSRQSTMDEQSSTANNGSTKRRSIGPTLTPEELAVLREDTTMNDVPQGNGEVATDWETGAQHVQPLRTETEEDEVRDELLEKGDREAVFLQENDIPDLSSIPSPPKIAQSPKYSLIDVAKMTEAETYTRISVASYLSSSPVPSSPPQKGMMEAEPPTRNIIEDIATIIPERHEELPDNLPVPTATEDESKLRKHEMMDIDSPCSADRSSSLGPSAALFHTSHQLQHTVTHSSPLKQQVTAATSSLSPELIPDDKMDVSKPREAEKSSSLGPSAALFTFSYPVQTNHHVAVPSSPLKQQITDATSSQSPQLFTFAQPAPTLEGILTEAEVKAFKSERPDSFDSIPSDCTFASSYKAELAELAASEKAARLAVSKQSHDDDESESEGFKESVLDSDSDMEAEVLLERRSEKCVREPSSSSSKRTASDTFSSGRDTEIVIMWRDGVSAEENATRLARKAVLEQGEVEDEDEEDSDSGEDNEPSELGGAGLPNDPIELFPSIKSQPSGNRVAREEGREIEPEAVPSKDDLDDFCRTSDIDPAETHQERGLVFRVASSTDDSALDEEEDMDGDADVEMAEMQELIVPMSSLKKGRRDVYDDISGANDSESDSESESEEEGEDEEEEDDKRRSVRDVRKEMQVPMQSIEVDVSKDAINTSGGAIRASAVELQTATVEIKKEPSLPRPTIAASALPQPPQQDGNSAAGLIIQLRSLLCRIQSPDLTLSKPEVMDIERELNRIELTRDGKRLRVKAAADRRRRGNE